MTPRLLTLLAAVGLYSTSAFAQATPVQTAPANAARSTERAPVSPEADSGRLPDVVRLSNGGVVRGVIEVNLPGQYVEIRTNAGELMRFAASEIGYAGPSPEPGPAAPDGTEAKGAGIAVKFDSSRPGTRFYLSSKPGELQLVCTAPCEGVVAANPGPTTFALAVGNRKPALAAPVELVPGASYFGDFSSRRGVRIAGGIILAASLISAIPLIVVGARGSAVCSSYSSSSGSSTSCADETDLVLLVPGVVVGIGGTVAGIMMLLRGDRASVWKAR